MDEQLWPRPATEEELRQPGIYVIVFENPWAVYVGSAGDCFASRFERHMRLLYHRRHTCRALQERYDRENPESIRFLIMGVFHDRYEARRQEAACLNLFSQISACEILNNGGDSVVRRAKQAVSAS